MSHTKKRKSQLPGALRSAKSPAVERAVDVEEEFFRGRWETLGPWWEGAGCWDRHGTVGHSDL